MKRLSMNETYIKNENIVIRLICDYQLLKMLKDEYGNYYLFDKEFSKIDFNIYVYINEAKYQKIITELNISNKNLIYLKNRDGIIINISNNDIFILYNKITDNLIQFIGENIISIFGLFFEQKGYLYFHAACVDKCSNGIAIIGERNSGKTTLLNILLQNGFNFVSNSHLGIKTFDNNLVGLGSPSRIGIRLGTLKTVLNNTTLQAIIRGTEFKHKFDINDIKHNLSFYESRKFNIKINELKEIYNINLINKTNIKFILIPVYMPELQHIQIKSLNKEEKIETLLKSVRKGSYDTIRYMDNLFINKHNSLSRLTNIANNVPVYKIFQNEKNINELLNFICKQITLEGD